MFKILKIFFCYQLGMKIWVLNTLWCILCQKWKYIYTHIHTYYFWNQLQNRYTFLYNKYTEFSVSDWWGVPNSVLWNTWGWFPVMLFGFLMYMRLTLLRKCKAALETNVKYYKMIITLYYHIIISCSYYYFSYFIIWYTLWYNRNSDHKFTRMGLNTISFWPIHSYFTVTSLCTDALIINLIFTNEAHEIDCTIMQYLPSSSRNTDQFFTYWLIIICVDDICHN
jgi:hypothetical protein